MPCYQSRKLPLGFSTTGRQSYKTEAECNQACKDGACCEGPTCTVKPQCQCQGTGKTFKGVGTVCEAGTCLCCNLDGTPKQSSGCVWCWCFCGEGAAVYPRFVNVSVSIEYKLSRGIGGVQTKTFTTSLTLSLTSQANRDSCPVWKYGEIGGYFIPVNQFVVPSFLPFGNGTGAIHLTHQNTSPTSTQFSVALAFLDFSDQNFNQSERWHTGAGFTGSEYKDSYDTFASSSGVQTSGTCFSDITGASVSREMPIGTSSATFPIVSGETNMKWTVSVVGVQQ